LLLGPDGDYLDHERDGLGYDKVQVESYASSLDGVDKIDAPSADFEKIKNLEVQLNPMIERLSRAASWQK
ncbi:Cof-type HAD-IIB family hydrolase, partial [Pseudomonas syringae pv. tagetis]